MKARTKGLSPKVLSDLIVTVVAAVLLAVFAFDVEQDPVLWGALSKLAGSLAGIIAGPGLVEADGPAFIRDPEPVPDVEEGRNA